MNWAHLTRLAIAASFFITCASFSVNAEEVKSSPPFGQAVYSYGRTLHVGELNANRIFAFLVDTSGYVKTLTDSIVTKSFSNVVVYYNPAKTSQPVTDQVLPFLLNSANHMFRDESDRHKKFSFAIEDKIKLIVNLRSWVSLYAGYQASYLPGLAHASDQLNSQTVPPLISQAEGLDVRLHKNVLYHGPFVELKFRW